MLHVCNRRICFDRDTQVSIYEVLGFLLDLGAVRLRRERGSLAFGAGGGVALLLDFAFPFGRLMGED